VSAASILRSSRAGWVVRSSSSGTRNRAVEVDPITGGNQMTHTTSYSEETHRT
jgi:hypothetical protein